MKNGKSRLAAKKINFDKMFEISRQNIVNNMLESLMPRDERDELDIQFEGIDDEYLCIPLGNVDRNGYTKFDIMNNYPDSDNIFYGDSTQAMFRKYTEKI